MIIGVVFKDGKEMDRGIWVEGKKWVEQYPEQRIGIVTNTDDMDVRVYTHSDSISFQELQDNGYGWEVVYDSNERVDRTVEYSLPRWFTNCEPIPDYKHHINDEGEVESEFKGYLK